MTVPGAAGDPHPVLGPFGVATVAGADAPVVGAAVVVDGAAPPDPPHAARAIGTTMSTMIASGNLRDLSGASPVHMELRPLRLRTVRPRLALCVIVYSRMDGVVRSNSGAGGSAARADIRQVAARAGLSTATVSRVLTGTGPASADAIQRVEAAVRELDYLPNASASSLRTDRSMMIGVLVPNLANPVFLPFLRAVEHTAQPLGYAVVVADTQNSTRIERQQLDRLIAQGIDGLVMAGRPRHPDQVRRLSRAGMPVVEPETFAEHAGTSMRARTTTAVEQACRHLASLGHRRLAFVTRSSTLSGASASRWDTIVGICRALGIEPRHVALMTGPDADGLNVALVATMLAALTGSAGSPSVIWSNSMVLAPLLLEALAIADIEIPAECSFLTFGDSPWATAYRPPITVISGDLGSVANVMTESLLRRLGAVGAEPAVELQPDAYLARSSVGPAPEAGR